MIKTTAHTVAALFLISISVHSINPADNPVRPVQSERTLEALVESYGFEFHYIDRLWFIESAYRDDVIGLAREVGRGQVKLSTARDYDSLATIDLLKDSLYNASITLTHLSFLRDKLARRGYGGRRLKLLTFSAYNRGLGRVYADIHRGRDPVNSYARRIVR